MHKDMLSYYKANPKQKMTLYKNWVKLKREKKTVCIDLKKPHFEDIKIEKFFPLIKIERFAQIAESLLDNYIVINHIGGVWYTIEGQKLIGGTNFFKDARFIDINNGAYLNGFHYFTTYEQALEIARESLYNYAVIKVFIYKSHARGIYKGKEIHVTNLIDTYR